jgi:exosome complex RNA-binding protein Csl4
MSGPSSGSGTKRKPCGELAGDKEEEAQGGAYKDRRTELKASIVQVAGSDDANHKVRVIMASLTTAEK